MPKPRTLCLCALTNDVSGTEHVLFEIAMDQLRRGQRVHAVLPLTSPRLEGFARRLEAGGVSVTPIEGVGGRRNPIQKLGRARAAFAAIRPDLVHFHCPHIRWGLEVVLSARLAGVKTLVRTEHNPLLSPPGRLIAPVLHVADRFVSAFTYVSTGNQNRFESFLPHRMGRGNFIANGIDLNRFAPMSNPGDRAAFRRELSLPDETFLAVYVGSYGGRRPLKPVFDAFGKLLGDPQTAMAANNCHLLVIGEGDPAEKRIDNPDVESRVHFLGRRDDIARLLPLCDLFVSSSQFEGMSIASLESWASGLPVLMMEVDGLSDILSVADTPLWRVSQGDTTGFAALWGRILRRDPDILQVHETATNIVRSQMDLRRTLDQYDQLYAKLWELR